jgi:hypothetical protein
LLTRIALHQTRLKTPGLGLDAKGVALGAKGLVLVPTVDRLVGWLSVYTRERSLEDLLASLELRFVRSAMGTQEITLTFLAESSDRMDRIAETARLVGAFTFTGTSRHFVQYRDAAAPFGYDAAELLSTEASLALYHDQFSQTYSDGKLVDLRALLLRLMPQVDPRTLDEPGTRYVVAEEGLGPALIHYLVRSQVEGEVTMGEWPPASAFDETPVRRYIMRIPELPLRMRKLMRATPGLTSFVPVGPGVAIEIGYRHPVQLRACPVFDPNGLVLVRGRGDEPWGLARLPAFGDLRSFARIELRGGKEAPVSTARSVGAPDAVRVGLRLMPASSPWRNVTASWIPTDKLPLLRRLAYVLAPGTLRDTRIALTDRGAFLTCSHGIEAVPLGTFFVESHPGLFTPAGLDVVPKVAPEVLHRALGSPEGHALFIGQNAVAIAIPNDAFVSLETAILESKSWDALTAEAIESALAEAPIDLKLTPVGLFPLAGASPAPPLDPTKQLPAAPDAVMLAYGAPPALAEDDDGAA